MQSYGDARGSNGRLEDLKVDNFDTQVQDASDKAFELSQRASGFLRREKIRARLGEAVYNKGCPQAEQFIIPQDLHEIWRPQILRNFLGVLGYSGEENLVQTVLDHLIKTISILVYIRWEEWSRFESIFFPNGWGKPVREDRTDARIPYPDIILEEDQFLGSGDAAASDFFNHQNVYIPKIIEQGKRILIPKTTPLPFIKKQQEKIAVGGYGVVTKEVIAKHHFRPKSKFGSDPIKREFAVACKKFQTRGDFRAEAKNLDNLASALSKHERLVKHIAFITIGDVHDPGATKEFNILLPMADTDLKRLLYLEQYSPQCSDVVELVKEASKVFDALAWLHQGQMVEDKMQVFCHMDLKPANILVYEIGEYKFPAGCWMISDFGISSMTERHQNTQFLNTFEKSPAGTLASILGADSVLTSRKREPGIYSAPEAHKLNGKIGPASDVWSLGCILFQVLLRGVGGSEGIADLVKYDEKRRSKEHDHFCQHTDGEAHLHPAIERWLESTHLPGHIAIQDQKMIMECKNVIKQALIVDPDKRATAANLRDRLLLICEREEISNESVAGSPITSKPPFPMETSSAMPLPDRTTTNFQPTQPNPLEETKDLRLQQPESSAQPSQVAAAAFTLPPKSFSPAPTAAPPTPPDDHHIAHDLDTTDKLKHDTTGNNPSTQPENDIPRKQAKLQPLIPDRVSSHTRETALPVSKESTPAVIEPPPTFPRESVRSVDIGPFETRHRSSTLSIGISRSSIVRPKSDNTSVCFSS
ncbi:kinase-like protein [Mollisia scopiformis]|uniref:non-specific serine/threonine protein kinase n=1 Tax=Mollisia scopiformis TaxID=149040 RepID=A0A194XTS2_MOLSC|nr:kinase-like protein [Mollisia scopiformis]KUJ23541.1 kinase-like protein [Mollisia scopiformis]